MTGAAPSMELPLPEAIPPPIPPAALSPISAATALPAATPPPIPAAARSPIPRATPSPDVAPGRKRRRAAQLVPGARIGVWRIERELGRGGMATVYAVVHTRFGKRAALKLVHSAILGPQFTAATFLREARVANLVNHPGVIDVFGTGSHTGRPYLAMERLEGRSLGAVLESGALPRDTAIEILLELCDVLEVAHAAGVTHGDLKVDNVFVLDQPGAGGRRTKLLDWGIARIAGEDDPLRGMIAGTLTYVAPEQIRCDDVTPAADVYALGVLAYRLLLGEPPFAAATDLDLLRKHLCGVPPSPRTRWPAIPAELEAVLVAMLAKQPEARPRLCEIAGVLRATRRQIRPRPVRTWIAPVAAIPPDVIGRPVLAKLPGRAQRITGAALGVALVIASLLRVLSA
ncbi:MAG: serine/threonine protein kinase [Deltaproteobacteria bacterium]|nr:MAG: serine/threonine protein kinase [Deltaproteobacteria bacterium]